MIGLPQLLDTVGRATAATHDLSPSRFVTVSGDLHHALDYIPEESEFWETCIRELIPQIERCLTIGPNA